MSVRVHAAHRLLRFAITIVMLVLVLEAGDRQEANGSRAGSYRGFGCSPLMAKMAFAIWSASATARRMERASLRRCWDSTAPAAVVALVDRGPARPRTDRVDGHHLVGPVAGMRLPLRRLPQLTGGGRRLGRHPGGVRGPRSDRVRSLNPENDPQDSGLPGPTGKGAGSRWHFRRRSGPRRGQVATSCPTPTTTLFSPSSAKSWVLSARSDCWGYSIVRLHRHAHR